MLVISGWSQLETSLGQLCLMSPSCLSMCACTYMLWKPEILKTFHCCKLYPRLVCSLLSSFPQTCFRCFKGGNTHIQFGAWAPGRWGFCSRWSCWSPSCCRCRCVNPDFQLLQFKLDDFISVCARLWPRCTLAPTADIQTSQSPLAKNHTLISGRSINTSTVRLCSER